MTDEEVDAVASQVHDDDADGDQENQASTTAPEGQMDDITLKAICEAKLNNSLGWLGGRLSKERQAALEYYRGDAFGNEQEGRSQVISRDVAEAVDSVMPGLIKVFASADTLVNCEPRTQAEEEIAKQATDYLNWVFQSQPSAFELIQTWLMDGLLAKIGIVKSWWDESKEVATEEYEGLTRFQYLSLISNPDVEVVSVNPRPQDKPQLTPEDIQAKIAQVLQAIAGASQGAAAGAGAPGAPPQGTGPQQPPQAPQGQAPAAPQPGAGGAPQPPAPQAPGQAGPAGSPNPIEVPDDGLAYDCVVRRYKTRGKICIAAIPPEEFLTDRRAVSLETTTFCAHRTRETVSSLIEMGYDAEKVRQLAGGTDLDYNSEVLTRFETEDEMPDVSNTDNFDPSMQHVWYAECYLKVDYDGDGVAEWRKVCLAGSGGMEILDNDQCDGHPFSAWTPNKLPHKLHGESLADKTMDLQLIKSTVWRQVLDGMYFNNAPQLVVVEGQANMGDVLTRRPGGIIRAKSIGAVEPLPVQDVSVSGMSMINYLDSVREARTGVRRFSSALDADALNPYNGTATGARMVEDSSQDRVMLMARNFAEQGLKSLFKRLFELTCKHVDKATTVRLRGKWVDVDPSSWGDSMDMTVTVGLGTGNKDTQSQRLMTMMTQIDAPLIQMQGGLNGPLLKAQNVYNKLTKLTESMGYRSASEFYCDPSDPANAMPPPEPKPDPAMQMAQAQIQIEQQKAQSKFQLDQHKAQLDAQSQQAAAQLKAQIEQTQAQHDMVLQQQKTEHQIAMERMRVMADIEIARQKATAEAQAHIAVTQAKIAQQPQQVAVAA